MTLAIIISAVTGALAVRKGYNFFIWALAAGIPGLVILSFMPFSNKENQPAEERAALDTPLERIILFEGKIYSCRTTQPGLT
jgi:hypothetical protein